MSYKLCVILNGPPGVGKDTLAERLEAYGFHHQSFKTQLYRDTATHFRVDLDVFKAAATDRELKERPFAPTGISPRDMMIYTSEKVMKPALGEDYYGKAAVQRCIWNDLPLVVFSDGGFKEEILPLQDLYEHVVIFRLHRDGFDFNNDSRSYISDAYGNVYDIHLVNDAIEKGVSTMLDTLEPFVGGQNRQPLYG